MVSATTLRMLFMCAIGLAFSPVMAAPDVLLEAVLEPEQVYVQAQARYRLRFYHAIDVRDLVLHAPSARVADLRPLGDARVYESMRDGRRYRVHERSYAVLPFASGPLQLSGAHATGRVPAAMPRTADGRQAMRIDASPKTLIVLPAPVTDGRWLPAQSLKLGESWSTEGSARKRTIRIEAAGADATQLPELQVSAPGVTVQALPARLENRIEGEQLIGIREQSFLITPTRAGIISLPVVQLPWWTPDGTPMTAALPASTLQGLSGGTTSAAPTSGNEAKPGTGFFQAWLLWFTAALLLGAAIFCAVRQKHLFRLMHASWRGDARAVCSALLAWADDRWRHSPPRTLGALAERLQDPVAREALAKLDCSLYGAVDRKMDRAALRATVLQVMRSDRHRQYDLPVSHHTSGTRSNINNMG